MRTELADIFDAAILLTDLDSALPQGAIHKLSPGMPTYCDFSHPKSSLSGRSFNQKRQVEIAAIISNHDTLRSLVERSDTPLLPKGHYYL